MGDDTVVTTSAERAPTVTVVGDTVLLADDGSVVAVDTVAEPPLIEPGAVVAGTETGMATVAVAPLASVPATVQVTVVVPLQPDGNVPTVTPAGTTYTNMVGPTASDGPSFDAVRTTVPDVPGVIVGVDTVMATSALRAPAVTVVEATELLAVAGSVVAVETEAEPPVSAPGAVDAARETGMATLVVVPLASGPAIVQVTVPEASVQPDGSAPSTTPAGGVYVNVVGPTASDGPAFVAVSVTVPDWPGVIVGEVTAMATSAERAPAVTVVEATELFAVAGSVDVVATDAAPPVRLPGAVDEASDTGIVTLVVAPLASVALIVQVTVPDASVQPPGRVPSVTPAGTG